MSNFENSVEQRTESVEMVDCGAASEVTKGSWLGLLFEGAPPPFSWILIM